jgi:DNA-binding transcriptional LysR family regulator
MRNLHTWVMDMLGCCRAFVTVADRHSFTRGATWIGLSQPVASRRISALEQRLGGQLLDRAGRTATLTPLGRHLIPIARRLVEAADELVLHADETRLAAVPIAIPDGCEVRDIAAVDLAGRDADTNVLLIPAQPRARAELLSLGQVHAAVLACAITESTWHTSLGVGRAVASAGPLHLDSMRPERGHSVTRGPRVWLLPEDDVPHIRDPLVAAGESAGLAPSQVSVAASPAAALASVLASSDVVITSPREARRFDLSWAPLADVDLSRGYVLRSSGTAEVRRLATAVGDTLAEALGAAVTKDA